MCSTVPLFRRVILQSGTPAGNMAPMNLIAKEAQYLALLQYCGIKEDDERRLEKLREVPVETLVRAIRDLAVTDFGPWEDASFFPVTPSYGTQADLIHRCAWVDDFIIGDACFEVFLLTDAYSQCLISL